MVSVLFGQSLHGKQMYLPYIQRPIEMFLMFHSMQIQNTGYSIYYDGQWTIYGGTSCAAPLWAAFTARINQERVANQKPVLGFANPLLYAIGVGSSYTVKFS